MTETKEEAALSPDRWTVADVFADVGIDIIPIAEASA